MGDATKITLGPCEVSIKSYVAGAYTRGFTSVGYLTEKGAKFHYKGEELKIKCGNQLGVIKKLLVSEEATLELALEEFTIENLAQAFGLLSGDIIDDTVNHYKYIQIGGNQDSNFFTIKVTSQLDDGTTLTLCLYKVQIARDSKIELSPDKVVEIPLKVNALGDTNSGTLNDLGYFEIV